MDFFQEDQKIERDYKCMHEKIDHAQVVEKLVPKNEKLGERVRNEVDENERDQNISFKL